MSRNNREEQERLHLYQQYTEAYGPLADEGEFNVDEPVEFYNGASWGEVIWKYINDQGLLIYVIDNRSGFPVEVSALEVRKP